MNKILPKYTLPSALLIVVVEYAFWRWLYTLPLLYKIKTITFYKRILLSSAWIGLNRIWAYAELPKGERVPNPSLRTCMIYPRKLIRLGSSHLANPPLSQSCQLQLHWMPWHIHALANRETHLMKVKELSRAWYIRWTVKIIFEVYGILVLSSGG